jgi:hypothetical protein
VIDKATHALGGPIAAAREAGPLATMNLANPQFIQVVMGIKALKGTGIIQNNAQCEQLAASVAMAVLGETGSGQQAGMTRELGDAACNTAVPNGTPGGGQAVQAPPLVPIPGAAQSALGVEPGFGNIPFQIRPLAQCTLFPNPVLPPGVFMILSNYTAANYDPMRNSWVPVAQLFLDGTGIFFLRGPVQGFPVHLGFASSGQMFAIDNMTGQLALAASVGMCQG